MRTIDNSRVAVVLAETSLELQPATFTPGQLNYNVNCESLLSKTWFHNQSNCSEMHIPKCDITGYFLLDRVLSIEFHVEKSTIYRLFMQTFASDWPNVTADIDQCLYNEWCHLLSSWLLYKCYSFKYSVWIQWSQLQRARSNSSLSVFSTGYCSSDTLFTIHHAFFDRIRRLCN